jgi:hypothetical protein
MLHLVGDLKRKPLANDDHPTFVVLFVHGLFHKSRRTLHRGHKPSDHMEGNQPGEAPIGLLPWKKRGYLVVVGVALNSCDCVFDAVSAHLLIHITVLPARHTHLTVSGVKARGRRG